jgi:hypothetical protein
LKSGIVIVNGGSETGRPVVELGLELELDSIFVVLSRCGCGSVSEKHTTSE